MTKQFDHAQRLAARYKDILFDLGYPAKPADEYNREEDSDYALLVTYNGLKLLCVFDGDDPSFVRIVVPKFFPEPAIPDEKIGPVAALVNDINRTCKGVKVYIEGLKEGQQPDVTASVEFLDQLTEADGVGTLDAKAITRYLSMLENGVRVFARRYEEI